MKLLIFTQRVDRNDDQLSFFLGWIIEFAKQCEQITVVCLYKGEYELPNNVKVLSLGKESVSQKPACRRGRSVKSKVHKVKLRFIYIINFYKFIWRERKNYDAVFVHMNQIYVILGGIFWRLYHKKIGLWYAHGSVSTSLKLAEKLTNIIFTATPESFRINSPKKKVVGHGIDTNMLKATCPRTGESSKLKAIFKVITVGRVSPIKNLEVLIKAVEILSIEIKNLKLQIIGGPGTPEHEEYLLKLKELVIQKNLSDVVEFVGPKPYKEALAYFESASLFVNASDTGSLDKAILDAMSFETPILTCNESLADVLIGYKNKLMFEKGNSVELADKIKMIYNMEESDRQKIGRDMREIVVRDHDLAGLIKKIIFFYNIL